MPEVDRVVVPESGMKVVTELIIETLPRDPQDENRLRAAAWLRDLHHSVHGWNRGFIDLLKTYPGFTKSQNENSYRIYFQALNEYGKGLDERRDDIKQSLCAPLKALYAKFPESFEWIRIKDPEKYDRIHRDVTASYRNESGIIFYAYRFYRDMFRLSGRFEEPERLIDDHAFLQWNVQNYPTLVDLIDNYETQSLEAEKSIREAAERAQIELCSLEELNAIMKGVMPSTTTRETRRTTMNPQFEHPTLYRILGFAFGVVFVGALLAITVAIPDPTTFQIRVFITVLAVALAGAAGVITGLIDVQATLGKQLIVGASGAFAVFVITFLFNPAVL